MKAPRKIEYLPPSGENRSPADYIQSLTPEEAASIRLKLENIAALEPYEWPHKWVKLVDRMNQFTYGDHRFYFLLDGRTLLIVYYACRKVSQKAKRQDLNNARANRDLYYQKYQKAK